MTTPDYRAALPQPEPEFTDDEVDMIQAPWSYLTPPQPEDPTDEELMAVFWQGAGLFGAGTGDHIRGLRAVLARWGRPAVKPVPVSERLPKPGDVNDDGEVWVEEPPYDYSLGDTGDYDTEPGRWVLRPLSSLDKRNKRRWLPHHALPVPEVTP